MPAYRSFLFAPGNHARKVMKVFDCGADHVPLRDDREVSCSCSSLLRRTVTVLSRWRLPSTTIENIIREDRARSHPFGMAKYQGVLGGGH